MGQYLDGQKIGTCENMYYLRLDEAQAYAKQGREDEDGITFKEYLEDDQTRFRFHWPEEDQQTFKIHGCNRNHDKSFSLPCPVEVNHGDICIHNAHKGGGHGMNIFLPCPHSKEAHYRTSNGGAGEQFIDVCFQAIREGKEKTIFRCSRCGKMQRFSDEDIEKIKARAIEYFSVYKRETEEAYKYGGNKSMYEYAMKIIERIR